MKWSRRLSFPQPTSEALNGSDPIRNVSQAIEILKDTLPINYCKRSRFGLRAGSLDA